MRRLRAQTPVGCFTYFRCLVPARSHILVERISVVHLVHFGVHAVDPSLQECGIVPAQLFLLLFHRRVLEVEHVHVVVERLRSKFDGIA